MVQAIINPDADPETTTVDGFAGRSYGAAGDTWADLHGGAGISGSGTVLEANCGWQCAGAAYEDKFLSLGRMFFLFDLSSIPLGADIISVTLGVYDDGTGNKTLSYECSVNVFGSTPASNIEIVKADYQNVGSTAYATAITYTNWVQAGWNTFIFNSTGIGVVRSALGSILKLSLREASYDAPDTTPSWEADGRIIFAVKMADNTTLIPKLTIIYNPAKPSVTTDVATDITSTSATLNGEITDVGGENLYERGFEWAETQDVPMTNSWTESGDFGTGTFSHGISGLDSSKTYYYRAKAQNNYGWGYGAVRTFLGAHVYPAEAITRVTNLIHRYSPGNFTLEMALGEVTSDFGLPQYTARPVASTPVKEEEQVVTKMGVEGFQTAEQFMDVMEQGYQGRPMPESVRAKAEKTATAVEKHNREVLERLQRLAVAKQEAKDLREQVAATRERLAAVAREEEATQKRIAELKAAGAGKPVPTFAEWLAAQAKKVVERFMWWK